LRHAVRAVTVADVDASVRATLRMSSGMLQSKSRSWAVTHPRMIAIYLCRKHTAATYGEISKHFGAKTHSTAVAAEKKVRAWLEKNENLAIGERNWQAKELMVSSNHIIKQLSICPRRYIVLLRMHTLP
jgi:chromosomal replication initiator protein